MASSDPNAKESLAFSRLACVPGVATLHARDCARQWSVHHDTFTFCPIFHVGGAGPGWIYRGRRETITPGVIMLMEPGEVHRNTEVTPPSEFRVFFIQAEQMRSLVEEWGRPVRHLHWRLQQSSDPEIHGSLVALHHLLLRESTAPMLEEAFTQAISLMIERCGENGGSGPNSGNAEPARIAKAVEYLEDRMHEPVSLQELARHVGLSRFHLLRAFRKHKGVPPHEYQILRRVSRGRTLMDAGRPPAEVALELGFSDQSHFGRHFKRVLGVSPARYLKG